MPAAAAPPPPRHNQHARERRRRRRLSTSRRHDGAFGATRAAAGRVLARRGRVERAARIPRGPRPRDARARRVHRATRARATRARRRRLARERRRRAVGGRVPRVARSARGMRPRAQPPPRPRQSVPPVLPVPLRRRRAAEGRAPERNRRLLQAAGRPLGPARADGVHVLLDGARQRHPRRPQRHPRRHRLRRRGADTVPHRVRRVTGVARRRGIIRQGQRHVGPREALLRLPRHLHDVLRRVHRGVVPQRVRAASDGVGDVLRGDAPRGHRRRHRGAHQLDVLALLRLLRAVGGRDPVAPVLGHGQRDHEAAGREHNLPAAGRRRQRRPGELGRARAMGEHQVGAGPRHVGGGGVGRQASTPDVAGDAVRRRHRGDARVHHAPRAPGGRRRRPRRR
mmetsp:Transcript_2888/g.12914  ORF Transcript_2888/g.12914 Transcript_2888/m.12914 type:complete len:397 (+) Transcript_2888:3-1193(+)